MIRVTKAEQAPDDLEKKGYKSDGVYKQLLFDQNDKCYICERILTTDYEEEHLHSQNNYPSSEEEWDNLFIACGYCNKKKSNRFDDILNPSKNNIEDIIRQTFVPDKKSFEFECTGDSCSNEVQSTISLLNLVFNGRSLGMRKLREERFYKYFIEKYNFFCEAIDCYLSGKKDEYRQIIEDSLNIKSEFLGFKYAIIKENAVLYKDFGHLIVWNK